METTNTLPGKKLSSGLYIRLSLMMFLQYAIWGAWLPLLWTYLTSHLGFTDNQFGTILAVGAVGAIFAPFLAGQIADRFFNTEKYLGLSHIIGGILVWQLCWLDNYWYFLVFSLLYSIIYSPTISLTNSLAFHHLPDRDRHFGLIRLWGTIGWIIVGIGMGQWLLHMHSPAGVSEAALKAAQAAGISDAFTLSGIAGILMGIFCFLFLPRTPPNAENKNNAAFKALGAVKRNPLFLLFLLAIPVSCIHQLYFAHTAKFLGNFQVKEVSESINSIFGVGGGGLMTIGQMSEILVLAMIPMVAKKISRKWLLAAGLVAYGLRMFLFAYADSAWMPMDIMTTLIMGIAMHGFCFGCFIFVAYMIVDEECTVDVRASAQSLFNLVIVGIGIIVGSKIAGWLATWAKTKQGEYDYTKLFNVPMWAALGCLTILILFYPRKSKNQ